MYNLPYMVMFIMIAEKLRTYLDDNKISVSKLSMQIGLPELYLNDCLSGKTNLKASDFIAICKALNLDIDFFK